MSDPSSGINSWVRSGFRRTASMKKSRSETENVDAHEGDPYHEVEAGTIQEGTHQRLTVSGSNSTQVLSWRRKEMFCLTMHSTHFILQLYVGGLMVKYDSDSEIGNSLLQHGILFPISSKGSFICTIPQTG